MTAKEEKASELCNSCGICCRGLLHSHGVLKPDEAARAADLGLDMIDGAEPAFALPCPKYRGCCTVYAERPRACRDFRCALLRRLDANEVSLDDALDIVREARRLADEALPGANNADLANRFRIHLRQRNPGAGEAEMPDVERLKFVALGLYLDRHFMLSRDGYFYSVQPFEGTST